MPDVGLESGAIAPPLELWEVGPFERAERQRHLALRRGLAAYWRGHSVRGAPLRYVLLGQGPLADRCAAWLIGRDTAPTLTVSDRLTTAEDRAQVADAQADFGLAIGYRHKLDAEALALFPTGVLNLHTSLLPYGRGAHPNVWAILADEPAGVTLHWMDATLDTGPIIAQQAVPVTFADTAGTLWAKTQEAAFTAFCGWWQEYEKAGWWPDGVPQSSDGFPTHKVADLDRTNDLPIDLRTITLLRARTFPGRAGYRYQHTDGGTYDLTIQIQAVTE